MRSFEDAQKLTLQLQEELKEIQNKLDKETVPIKDIENFLIHITKKNIITGQLMAINWTYHIDTGYSWVYDESSNT